MTLPKSLSSSIYCSLESLPHKALVINSSGVILFTNQSWDLCNYEYGLSTLKDWVGTDYLTLMQNLSIHPDQWVQIYESIQLILQGEELIFSSKFFIHTANKGDRIFRVDVFPLMVDHPSSVHTYVISHFDIGPFIEDIHMHTERIIHTPHKPQIDLTPICASCKSIRNAREEWIIIEHFLQQQHALQFTHDICPDCIRQLYPKYAGAFKR